jgi:hypothetical protein
VRALKNELLKRNTRRLSEVEGKHTQRQEPKTSIPENNKHCLRLRSVSELLKRNTRRLSEVEGKCIGKQ